VTVSLSRSLGFPRRNALLPRSLTFCVLDSLRVSLWKLAFRLFPAYRGTGGRVTHIEPDWSRVEVAVPLSWRTRNYVGTTFGGSMYGAVDPIYMLMLIRRLGDDYTVWDRAAEIRFERPGRGTLYATFELPDREIEAVRASLAPGESTERVYDVALTDEDGVVHAEVGKTVYVRRDR
jgi:acyl-coenzyme A thioesterase PaaI-like protein